MPSIPINNETEYTLTDDMAAQIVRDVQEYFGETISAIKVQYGIERHAYNARTGEVRYAFSPNDFGLIDTTTRLPDTYYHAADIPSIDDDAEGSLVPAVYEDVPADEEEDEEEDRRETSLESLEEDLGEEEEEEEDFPELDDQFEDAEDEDNFMYDDDDYN